MADAFTANLRLCKPQVGADDSTWGAILNAQTFDMIDDAISGNVSISVTAGDVTLTVNNGSTDQARKAVLQFTGTPGATRNITAPNLPKTYLIVNAVTDGSSIVLNGGAGTTVTIPAGCRAVAFTDGATNAVLISVGLPTPLAFGAKGDGSTDDSAALQAWLSAIPQGGTGYLPAASNNYYKIGTALTHNGYVNLIGEGVASRIHYTGSGIALSLGSGATNGPRFSKLHNLYLTGTSSAGGGLHVQEAQEGLLLDQVFIDSFSGAGAYAMRMSASWDVTILGGHLKSSGYGLLADATTVNGISVNNNVTILGCDMSGNTTGLDFASGEGLLVAGCDFSNCTTGIELGRATSSPSVVSNATIISNYFECTNCIYLGRGAYGIGAVSYIDIQKNYLAGVTNCIYLYECDSVTVGAQTMSGANTVDSPVTGTCWNSENSLTDNSASGQTARLQGNAKGLISAANITATSIFKLPVYTVATLPAAIAGTKVFVTDATASTFWNVVAGGGSTPIVVTADGTNWRIG